MLRYPRISSLSFLLELEIASDRVWLRPLYTLLVRPVLTLSSICYATKAFQATASSSGRRYGGVYDRDPFAVIAPRLGPHFRSVLLSRDSQLKVVPPGGCLLFPTLY